MHNLCSITKHVGLREPNILMALLELLIGLLNVKLMKKITQLKLTVQSEI